MHTASNKDALRKFSSTKLCSKVTGRLSMPLIALILPSACGIVDLPDPERTADDKELHARLASECCFSKLWKHSKQRLGDLGTDATLLDFQPVRTAPPVLPTTQDGCVFPPLRHHQDEQQVNPLMVGGLVVSLASQGDTKVAWMDWRGHSAMWNAAIPKPNPVDPGRSRSNRPSKTSSATRPSWSGSFSAMDWAANCSAAFAARAVGFAKDIIGTQQ